MPQRTGNTQIKLKDSKIQEVTEEDVQELADGDSYQRGLSYYRQRRIFDSVRRESIIRGFCEGSSGGPYKVQVTLGTKSPSSQKIVGWDCECPRGDFCKHIVALLLTWIRAPVDFEERPAIADVLGKRSREELIALITRMVEAEPDLEDLIGLPVPAARKDESGEIDQAAIRRRVVAIVQRASDDYNGRWIPPGKVVHEMDKLKAIADEYARSHRWREAWKVYEAIAEEAYDTALQVDDESEVQSFLARCCDGLAECLAHAQGWKPDDRLGLIKSLYSLWQHNVEYGGMDIAEGADDAITENARPDERGMVESWLDGAVAAGNGDGWRRRAVGEFLISLKAKGGAGDDEILRCYQSLGLFQSAVDFLLDRRRVDDAIALAAEKLDNVYEALNTADKLVRLGAEHTAQAFTFVENWIGKEEGAGHGGEAERCRAWLADRYAAHGMPEKALALRLKLFETIPSDILYFSIRELAQNPPFDPTHWPALRPKLIGALKSRQSWEGLVEIYLEEGEARSALDALNIRTTPRFYDLSFDLSARVAELAEEPFPEESIRIYQDIAAKLIDQRSRGSYTMAAEFLKKVRRIYERTGRDNEWSAHIEDLRARHKSLRALKEELTLAGLD